MTLRTYLLITLSFGAVLLFSCDHKRVFESYDSVADAHWQKDSAFSFDCEIKDALLTYNLYINLRNSVDYPYSNVWMFITITPPEGVARTDTIEFALADPTGKWFGSGYGKFRDNKFQYRNNVFFPKAGTYNFKIQHGMRNDVLEGVSDVGVRVERIR